LAVSVRKVLSRLRARQREILAALAAPLRAEFQRLAVAIAELEREASTLSRRAKRPGGGESTPCALFDEPGEGGRVATTLDAEAAPAASGQATVLPMGTPLAERRTALVTYLRAKGGAGRQTILVDTGIPPGSLSALLARGRREGWLVRDEGGQWRAAA
jgi:hypothetical protein